MIPRADATTSVTGMEEWEGLGLAAPLVRGLYELGFKVPTPIQKEAIAVTMKTKGDVVGAAETVRILQYCTGNTYNYYCSTWLL